MKYLLLALIVFLSSKMFSSIQISKSTLTSPTQSTSGLEPYPDNKVRKFYQDHDKFQKYVNGLFNQFDTNHHGFLEKGEFSKAVNKISDKFHLDHIDSKQIQNLFDSHASSKRLDLANFTKIVQALFKDIAEFFDYLGHSQHIMEWMKNKSQFDKDLKKSFDLVDTNHNGLIDIDEAEGAMNYLSDLLNIVKPAPNVVEDGYKKMKNSQGLVGFPEFKDFIIHALTRYTDNARKYNQKVKHQ